MSKKFWWQFLYWAKTGKSGWGYIFDKNEYKRAVRKYRESQLMKFERKENRDNDKIMQNF